MGHTYVQFPHATHLSELIFMLSRLPLSNSPPRTGSDQFVPPVMLQPRITGSIPETAPSIRKWSRDIRSAPRIRLRPDCLAYSSRLLQNPKSRTRYRGIGPTKRQPSAPVQPWQASSTLVPRTHHSPAHQDDGGS